MTRSIPAGRTARRLTALSLLPWLVAAGCSSQPTTNAVPPPPAQSGTPIASPNGYNATNSGERVAPPTVRQLPPRSTASASDQGSGADMVTLDQSYTPFSAGKQWTYKVHASNGNQNQDGTVTWKVDEAATDKTAVTVVSDFAGEKHTVSNKVLKNADGTITITSVTDGQTQSQTVKPEDAQGQPQAQGPGSAAQSAGPVKGTRDKVTVPAGSFDALKVVNAAADGKSTVTAWYVPNIGMVKEDVAAQSEQGAINSVMELTAYQ